MIKNLNISIIQTELHWEDKEKNLDAFSSYINSIESPTDLIVLPEMFNTGFSVKPEKLAETHFGETTQWLAQKASEKNCIITGSIIAVDKGEYFNCLIWMQPNGDYQYYDKRHLFRMANEHHLYTGGNEKLITELNGWKICPLICYDLRFPIWSRNRNDYDVLIYVANWPAVRSHAWKTLLQARAIENQAYVVGVNRIGKDGNGIEYSGDSMIVDPKGFQISKTPANTNSVETLSISFSELEKYRSQFPVAMDADNFELKS